MDERKPAMRYVGRFAPSPTGDLHFGSLVAAVASFLQARSHDGTWLVRIEDIDPPREVSGSAQRILRDLARLGMTPDSPPLYQSSRHSAYQDCIEDLLRRDLAFWCGCSRRDLAANEAYPGTCSQGVAAGRKPRAVRLRVYGEPVDFQDRIQGGRSYNLKKTCGDFVIRRADGLAAYQLAVAVDDSFQGITEIVRGADLLDSTARQIQVQRALGLTTPSYAHIPVARGADGKKLSKRYRSDPVGFLDRAEAIRSALSFLGHDAPVASLEDTWAWAVDHWSLARIPRTTGLEYPPPPKDPPSRRPGQAGRL